MSLMGMIGHEINRHMWSINSCAHSLDRMSCDDRITKKDLDSIEEELQAIEAATKECREWLSKAHKIMEAKNTTEVRLNSKEPFIQYMKRKGR